MKITGRDYEDFIPPHDPASRHYRSEAELDRRDWEHCDLADKKRKEDGVKNMLREHFDCSTTQVLLVGGPFDGLCHELQSGWPVPNKLLLPVEGGLAVYEVLECFGRFQGIEMPRAA